MATLNPVNPGITGSTLPYVAASAGGDSVVVGSNVYIFVRNTSGATVTVTLVTPGNEFNNQPIPDTAVTVPAATDVVIPIENQYKNGIGNCAITYSAVTSVSVAALAA